MSLTRKSYAKSKAFFIELFWNFCYLLEFSKFDFNIKATMNSLKISLLGLKE